MHIKSEHLVLAAVALYLWSRWKDETSVSLPSGTNLPMQGDPHEVPAQRTPLDVVGFPNLFNSALQIVERAIQLGPEHSPTSLEPDSDYDLAARVFSMQAALETNNGLAVYHYNTGNVTTAQGDYYLNPSTDTRHKYAVFLYPLQGAVEQVRRVKRLWPDAYKAAYSGSVAGFAKGLKPEGKPQYYEASEASYRAGMLARGKQFGWDAGVDRGPSRKLRLAPPTRRV